MFITQELLRKKRDGQELSREELAWFVAGITADTIPDYQVAAMLMAIYFRGMSQAELAAWADAMLRSGDILDLGHIRRPKVDKHSTGGVGDKISLPLAPAVAACGAAVPMVSGRGLGHTGGTLDKLESIPGFRVDLSAERFASQVDELGACLIGQTERIAPADRRLYALRDVTATVESVPLIASSIMSKKLAEGIDALVLDCKVGRGAFMKTADDARTLAGAIQVIGRAAGVPVTCVLSDMNAPIGETIGNALEVAESVAILRGEGPADTRELVVALGAEMLALAGIADGATDGERRIAASLDDGTALAIFRRMVKAQGGDPRVCDDPAAILPRAGAERTVAAETDGVITDIFADDLGLAGLCLGAGRTRKEDAVDPAVGIRLHHRVGDRVVRGEALATLHENGRGAERAHSLVTNAFVITTDGVPAPPPSRILEVIRS
ncbi:MAG TPA: thymidine phosphorylase [Kofleriaceae bacterium]|nr:thymidine phosphorylase [Kofleriaceae bacterium]